MSTTDIIIELEFADCPIEGLKYTQVIGVDTDRLASEFLGDLSAYLDSLPELAGAVWRFLPEDYWVADGASAGAFISREYADKYIFNADYAGRWPGVREGVTIYPTRIA